VLQGSDYYGILLAAIVKKSGGRYLLTENDISLVKGNDVVVILYDPVTKSITLEETSLKPKEEKEN